MSYIRSIFGLLPGDNAPNIHDPGKDRLPFENARLRPQLPFTKHLFQLLGDADGLQQAVCPNAVRRRHKIAHVRSVAFANFDVGGFKGLEHGGSHRDTAHLRRSTCGGEVVSFNFFSGAGR